ncbi:MAG: gamma-glutamylcyclotransferase family protein [Eubacteriales bacterium]
MAKNEPTKKPDQHRDSNPPWKRDFSLPSKQYIAYGSNLNVEQMKFRCPSATITGNSEIKDFELVFRGSKTGSYLTIEPKEGSVVPVVIWDIKPDDEKALDRYEGYPSFYGKEDMTVSVNGTEMTAMVYTMPTHHQHGIPTSNYVNTVAEGYVTAGFDLDILKEAVQSAELKTLAQEELQKENQEQIYEEHQIESMTGEEELPFQMRFD